MGQNKKIGIMGGTFNPIHIGHLILAETAYEDFKLDSVIFMPNKNQYYKENDDSVTNGERLCMISLAIESNPHLELSTMEYERPGTTYSVDTFEELNKEHPDCEFYFIMGADSLGYLETWKDYPRILQLATILVASRDEAGRISIIKRSREFKREHDCTRIYHLNSPSVGISSKDIRTRVKQKQTIKYLVPQPVEDYIKKHQLYE